VPSSRPVIIAGAGIGGLTAALAIAHRGSRVAVFDQAERLEESGAGIQLSPNASRVCSRSASPACGAMRSCPSCG
jgi:salicylate hydroxylase